MTSRKRRAAVLVAILALVLAATGAWAQVQVPLPGSKIPQFVDPLPKLTTMMAGTAKSPTQLYMREFQTQVLSTGTITPGVITKTWVWGYCTSEKGTPNASTYLGPVLLAKRGTPSTIEWWNRLGNTATSNLLAWKNSVDQTIHWADPLNQSANMGNMSSIPGQLPLAPWNQNYAGPIPAVVHLHGGEIPPVMDGGPNAWFTSDGKYHGDSFYSKDYKPGDVNNLAYAMYWYPNSQESAPIWFHDHTLGATRLGVYAGLAGAYVLTDPVNDPKNLPSITPLVIQDRMFDTNGQLYFPAGQNYPQLVSPNPEHPLWIPEFIGDTIVVNGRTWPYFSVQPKRARFLIINGSNARTYELSLSYEGTGATGPAIWQIATDGGYLDYPAKIDPAAGQKLLIMPGERADVIIDFAGIPNGTKLILGNTAPCPYPTGIPADPLTTGRIMEFRVGNLALADTTYNPASGVALRSKPIVRLADPVAGMVAAGVTVNRTRQLTVNEILDPPTFVGGVAYPGGPQQVVVNNSDFKGMSMTPVAGGPATASVRADFTALNSGSTTYYISEVPNEGDTELWEIVNLTMDAHPIHLHLAQFQVVNRQMYDPMGYPAAYGAAFPGGTYIPAWGPPLDYNTGNPRALGGNPDVVPFLVGMAMPPAPNEAGWKDTVYCPPGYVTRFIVRWAPQDKPLSATGAALAFPFDPRALNHGYVWHCHIIDHEDNEMMRPFAVNPLPGVVRKFVQGVDY